MSNYFLKHYIKKINEEYFNNIKRYIDKDEIIPTSCFYNDYSSKIKSAINYALQIEEEYKKWFNETINSYLRNRNYFQFNFTKKQNDEFKALYLSDKNKATKTLLNELSNQNKIYENQKTEKENNEIKETKSKLSENESSKDKEKFEKILTNLINLIKIEHKELATQLLKLIELY